MRSLRSAGPLALALLLCAHAHADMGPKPRQHGPGLQPTGDLEGLEVEMSAEEVELTLSQRDGADTLSVQATFHMTNHAASEQRFEVGFPVGPILNMDGFAATHSGHPVQAKLIDRAQGGKELSVEEARQANSGRKGGQGNHDFWYVWDAQFPAGESEHVVAYTLSVWHFSEHRGTGYVLRTGAPWKNAIGKAVVRLRCAGDLTLEHVTGLSPREGAEHKGDEVVWTFTDLEPTAAHDIGIRYNTLRTFAEQLARHRERAKVHFQAKCEVVYALQRAPERRLRADHDAEELSAYLAALRALVDDVEPDGDRLVLPEQEPANVHYPDDMPPQVKKMLQAQTGLETRPYARKGEADTLLRFFASVIGLATAHPDDPEALAALKTWTDLVHHFLAGRLCAGSTPMTCSAERSASLEAELETARALLAAQGS